MKINPTLIRTNKALKTIFISEVQLVIKSEK